MGQKENLEILSAGVHAWNAWRREYERRDAEGRFLRSILPDFQYAQLAGVMLAEANFRSAYLNGANLRGAMLAYANLQNANLNGADLSEASLVGADFQGAQLIGANFSHCVMCATQFGDVDLSNARGLDTVKHLGPSTIGIDSIFKSRGRISEVFLRAAGVPETFVTGMKSILSSSPPFTIYSCLISCSAEDGELSARLYLDLEVRGVRCNNAFNDVVLRDEHGNPIQIRHQYDKLLVILSEVSVGSSWVKKEIQIALEEEKIVPGRRVLFPICADGAAVKWWQDCAPELHHPLNEFTDWKDLRSYSKAFEDLLWNLEEGNTPLSP